MPAWEKERRYGLEGWEGDEEDDDDGDVKKEVILAASTRLMDIHWSPLQVNGETKENSFEWIFESFKQFYL